MVDPLEAAYCCLELLLLTFVGHVGCWTGLLLATIISAMRWTPTVMMSAPVLSVATPFAFLGLVQTRRLELRTIVAIALVTLIAAIVRVSLEFLLVPDELLLLLFPDGLLLFFLMAVLLHMTGLSAKETSSSK